jgi:hypothetical protein
VALSDVSNGRQIMKETSDLKPSRIPANAVLLVILFVVSVVLKFVAGPIGLIGLVLVLFLTVKLLIDVVRWLGLDKETRPKMKFPKKTALALLVVLLAVGYFLYLVARDLGIPDG